MIKRVVKYLKGTMQIGLVFGKEVNKHLPRDPSPYVLIKYADSNFARDFADQKSVKSYFFFLNEAVVL